MNSNNRVIFTSYPQNAVQANGLVTGCVVPVQNSRNLYEKLACFTSPVDLLAKFLFHGANPLIDQQVHAKHEEAEGYIAIALITSATNVHFGSFFTKHRVKIIAKTHNQKLISKNVVLSSMI
jgi:hypothetical protein